MMALHVQLVHSDKVLLFFSLGVVRAAKGWDYNNETDGPWDSVQMGQTEDCSRDNILLYRLLVFLPSKRNKIVHEITSNILR